MVFMAKSAAHSFLGEKSSVFNEGDWFIFGSFHNELLSILVLNIGTNLALRSL